MVETEDSGKQMGKKQEKEIKRKKGTNSTSINDTECQRAEIGFKNKKYFQLRRH